MAQVEGHKSKVEEGYSQAPDAKARQGPDLIKW